MSKRITGSGFTLVELMVVIAIIGILATIAIPQYASFRQKSYNSAAISDLRNVKTNLEAYYKDYQEYP
jgi:type IV pilus assembly protein PilA